MRISAKTVQHFRVNVETTLRGGVIAESAGLASQKSGILSDTPERTTIRIATIPERIMYNVKEVTVKLGKKVKLTFANVDFMPAKGKWFMMVSKKYLRLCGLSVGDVASIGFDIADQDAVTLPDELRFALDADDEATAAWVKLTAGKRRGFAYRVASAKMPETRERRVDEIMELLRAGE